jgi:hypothetical protein
VQGYEAKTDGVADSEFFKIDPVGGTVESTVASVAF